MEGLAHGFMSTSRPVSEKKQSTAVPDEEAGVTLAEVFLHLKYPPAA